MSQFGPWAAHPMFTHEVTREKAAAFSGFLGVPLVSTRVLRQESDRRDCLAACGDCPSIFLDPDTGVRLHRGERKRSTEFVFADELLKIAKARSHGMVLVFDQRVARGNERRQVQARLNHFTGQGLTGFAYISHASFLVFGQSSDLVHDARSQLVAASGLPEATIVSATPQAKPL
jgi:hypothetical protein